MYEEKDTSQMTDEEIRKSFQKCFHGKEGAIVLSYLKRLTLERYLGPDISTDA